MPRCERGWALPGAGTLTPRSWRGVEQDTMLEFLREQMFQHCRALEQMTEMHEALAGLGVDGHVHSFARKLSGYPLSGNEELRVVGVGER